VTDPHQQAFAEEQRNKTIGHAANLTKELVLAGGDAAIGLFASQLDTVAKALFDAQAIAGLKEAFPGAETEPTPTTFTQSVPAASNVVPIQPTPIPGATDGDPVLAGHWAHFFANPTAWKDNRASKKSNRSPDFLAPATGPFSDRKRDDGTLWPASLYIDDKKNPSDVLPRLRQLGYVQP